MHERCCPPRHGRSIERARAAASSPYVWAMSVGFPQKRQRSSILESALTNGSCHLIRKQDEWLTGVSTSASHGSKRPTLLGSTCPPTFCGTRVCRPSCHAP